MSEFICLDCGGIMGMAAGRLVCLSCGGALANRVGWQASPRIELDNIDIGDMTTVELLRFSEMAIWGSAYSCESNRTKYKHLSRMSHNECIKRNRLDIYSDAMERVTRSLQVCK